MTFFGQFLDHDMTFDQTSQLGVPAPPRKSPNARTAFFDLDSVYGDGPPAARKLFDPADPSKFRVETGGQFEDLPREVNKQAIIGDPRNDENLYHRQYVCPFLLFHNHAVDLVRLQGPSISINDAYLQARRLTLALPMDDSP